MEPTVLVLVAAGVADAAAFVAWLWFFRHAINAQAFLKYVVKLDAAGNRSRAVKLCNAAPSSLVSRYTLSLLSLRIPAKTMQDAVGGFRDIVPAEDFRVVAQRASNRMRSTLERQVHIVGGGGLACSLVALCLSLGAFHLHGRWPWEDWDAIDTTMKWAMGTGAFGLVALQSFARSWPRFLRELRLAESEILPRLVPEESMTEDQAAAAVAAEATRTLQPG